MALFVLPLCFLKGGSTLNNVPKHDIKLLIDEIYDVIGDPDFDLNEALGRNKATLNYFLDNTRLTKRLFQEAFHGLVRLELGEAEEDKQFNGLYYIEGLLLFSSYKLRKKTCKVELLSWKAPFHYLKMILYVVATGLRVGFFGTILWVSCGR